MPKDIRSYFTIGKKPSASAESSAPKSFAKKNVITDDDEDDFDKSKKEKKAPQKRRRVVIDSDDEDGGEKSEETEKSKKPNLKKLKESAPAKELKQVDPASMFGKEPVRAGAQLKTKKKEAEADISLTLDDDFDESMINLDETALIEDVERNAEKPKKTPQKSPVKSKNESKQKTPEKKTPQKQSTKISPKDTEKSSEIEQKQKLSPESKTSKLSEVVLEETPKTKEKKAKVPESSSNTQDLETSVMSDEDRFEKKRVAAVLYQKFKNRQTVINHGCKEVPKGKPGCLAGLSFLVTGILESMLREEATELIKSLGGKISSTVGKRLNYMVAGEEAGPKKLVTAEELGVKILSEDQLFDLIREKSGETKHNGTKDKSTSPEKKRKVKTENNEVPIKKEKVSPSPKKIKDENIKVKVESIKKEDPDIEINKEIKIESGIEAKNEDLPWVEKYKPKGLKEIIGQQGAASCCVKLKNWLSKWHSNHDGKKKLQKPNPWAKNDDGSYYKAALLSGPPGVGKTTTATLVCQELGFDTIEFNASDTRSKKLLQQEVSELLSNKSLYGYFHGDAKTVTNKHVLLMDEVDGMAGNEDRGGIQELISLIKDSSIPIICMCNDRNHQKMRSLVNYCYDLRFNKPRLEQIKGPIMSICFREKIKLPPGKIEEIIAATNNDIRQTLNNLSLIAAGKDLVPKEKDGETKKDQLAKKDLKLGPWEVVRKIFTEEENKKMSLYEKSDLFFHDYSLGPLFVQQNYLMVSPHVPKPQVPHQVALAAEALSLGDLVDKQIRSNSSWSLLPVQAVFSSVLPGEYMKGHFTGKIDFPAWLGKNSRTTKRSRLAQEIHDHTRVKTSGSKLSIRLDYAPFILSAIVTPLKTKGTEGVEEALNVMKEYRLLREDIESLIELTAWPGKKNPMDAVDSKVKAAFTRAYNKEATAFSHSASAGVKKKRAETGDGDMEMLEGEGEGETIVQVSDEEEDDNIENDGLIKTKKTSKAASTAGSSKAASTAGSTKSSSSASSSKSKASTSGKGNAKGKGKK